MNKKKVLICGATGFIGRNIANKLAKREDLEVYGTYYKNDSVTIPNVKLIGADLRDRDQVFNITKDKDIVLHMAAVTSGAEDIQNRPYIHVTDNIIMNHLLLRACFENSVDHFIYPSCTVIYNLSEKGLKEEDFNPSEEMLPNYFGVGWMKYSTEKFSEFFSRLGRTKHTIFRHSNVYGPHDKFDLEKGHVFGSKVKEIMSTENNEEIVMWGSKKDNDKIKRDLIYVDDLVDFIEMSMSLQEEPYGLYNVGYGKGISINELVKKIIDASGKKLKITYDTTKPTMPTSLWLNCSKAREEIGWTPKTSLEEGIIKTLDWYSENA